MILPTKHSRPSDSLLNIGAFIILELKAQPLNIDVLYQKVNKIYPAHLSIETLLLATTFLYILGKVEDCGHGVVKIKV